MNVAIARTSGKHRWVAGVESDLLDATAMSHKHICRLLSYNIKHPCCLITGRSSLYDKR